MPQPKLGPVSREGQEFFRTPQTFTQIEEIWKRNTDAKGHFDQEKARQEFDRYLGDRFSQQQKEALFTLMAGIYLAALATVTADAANKAEQSGDTATRDAATTAGSNATAGLTGLGLGTSESNQHRWGEQATRSLSAQQQADMLNAMLQAGFNQAVIFGLAQGIGNQSGLLGPDSNATVMQFLMGQAIMQTQQMAADVKKLEEKREDNERAKREYELEYARLCIFVGSEVRANDLTHTERLDPVAQAAVTGQYLRSRLDDGDLTIVPVQVQPTQAINKRRTQ
jgi:hypothetical protein